MEIEPVFYEGKDESKVSHTYVYGAATFEIELY